MEHGPPSDANVVSDEGYEAPASGIGNPETGDGVAPRGERAKDATGG